MSKHTPGPWKVDCERWIEGAGNRFVAKTAEKGFTAAENEEQSANAALIAAAPELLEALRRCIECLNGPVSDLMTGDALAAAGVYGALIQAGAAIAKAEGRE